MNWKAMTFSLLVCAIVSSRLYGESLSGIDIFIKACQNQGMNCALIRSGYAEIEKQEFLRKDIAKETAMLERAIEDHKKMFKDEPEMIEPFVTSVKKIISELKEEVTNCFRYRILFSGNDPGTGMRRVVTEKQTNEGTWELFDTLIMRGDIQKKNSTANVDVANDQFRVSNHNYYVLQFQKLGRIQDMTSKTATVSMLDANNLDEFIFLPHKIAEFKKTVAQLASHSKMSMLQVVGTTPYDNGKGKATILESRNAKGIVYMRYWIDPSRGYVCPLTQQYSPENGKIIKEYTAKNYFLHERSGLWFPQECEEKTWNDQNGLLMESLQFKINPATFKLNQAVSDDEFSIDVPEDFVVVDARVNPNEAYISIAKGALSLAQGGLDLDKMSWLRKEERIDTTPRPAIWNVTQYILLSSGIIVILIALFRMWRRHCANNT